MAAIPKYMKEEKLKFKFIIFRSEIGQNFMAYNWSNHCHELPNITLPKDGPKILSDLSL